jgi:hypothetical protein
LALRRLELLAARGYYLAHKFPYAILYTLEQDFILIIAVAPASREPGYWKHRIR